MQVTDQYGFCPIQLSLYILRHTQCCPTHLSNKSGFAIPFNSAYLLKCIMAQCNQEKKLMQPGFRSFTPKQSRWFAAGALLLALSASLQSRTRCRDVRQSPIGSRGGAVTMKSRPAAGSGNSNDGSAGDTCGAEYTALSRQWNTRPSCESKLYRLVPYKQNYLIARYSNRPNNQPTSANFGPARAPGGRQYGTEVPVEHEGQGRGANRKPCRPVVRLHAAKQLADLQQHERPPFRDTDYEPELILAFPLHMPLSALGLTPRMINFGLVHQSTGRPDPFERSWDRAYLQIGLDRMSTKSATVSRSWRGRGTACLKIY